MAGSRSQRRGEALTPASSGLTEGPESSTDVQNSPPTSGYLIVTFADEVVGNQRAAARELRDLTGITGMVSSSEFSDGAIALEEVADEECLYFNNLGIAAVKKRDDRAQILSRASESKVSNVLAVEEDYQVRESGQLESSTIDYLKGYRDAINDLVEKLIKGGMPDPQGLEAAQAIADNNSFTWGLQATRVSTSSLTGRGARIAVLDTGIDLNHSDFRGRVSMSKSFVDNETVQDMRGHGTHCAGTIAGPKTPATGRRYGVACDAELLVGKVLSNSGGGWTRQIVAAMDWAVAQKCHVISMSLGTDMSQQLMAYGQAGQRALDAGCLVVAAAGNNADRPRTFGFVEPPANASSVMAVGALNNRSAVAVFSARSNQNQTGGNVDIAAPGVAVYSSVPGSRYGLKDGTSMATPHVAGIAALWFEKTQKRGKALFQQLRDSALPLTVDSRDVGSGLVQAPQ